MSKRDHSGETKLLVKVQELLSPANKEARFVASQEGLGDRLCGNLKLKWHIYTLGATKCMNHSPDLVLDTRGVTAASSSSSSSRWPTTTPVVMLPVRNMLPEAIFSTLLLTTRHILSRSNGAFHPEWFNIVWSVEFWVIVLALWLTAEWWGANKEFPQ